MEKTEDKHEQLERQLEQRRLEIQRRFDANKIAELRRSKTQEVSESEKRAYVKRQLEGARLTPNETAEKRRLRTPETLENVNSQAEKTHLDNYREYKNLCKSNRIEWDDHPVQKNVNGLDIVPIEQVRPDWNAKSEDFWQFHGHTKEEYQSHAEKFPQIKEQLSQGKKIEEIKLDMELGSAAKFWYSEQPMKLTQYKYSLITESGFHRATLAKMYDLNDVPAEVQETHIKR